MFSIALKVVFPNSKICKSEKSVLSNSVWSMLTKLFRSVRRSLLYKGQWRRKWIANSVSLPQLHIGLWVSWKLCLNLCSRRWLSPSGIRATYLIPIGLWQSKNELEEGCLNFSMLIWKHCNYRIFVDWDQICSIQLSPTWRKNFWKNCDWF